jgi:hypothetical protein
MCSWNAGASLAAPAFLPPHFHLLLAPSQPSMLGPAPCKPIRVQGLVRLAQPAGPPCNGSHANTPPGLVSHMQRSIHTTPSLAHHAMECWPQPRPALAWSGSGWFHPFLSLSPLLNIITTRETRYRRAYSLCSTRTRYIFPSCCSFFYFRFRSFSLLVRKRGPTLPCPAQNGPFCSSRSFNPI